MLSGWRYESLKIKRKRKRKDCDNVENNKNYSQEGQKKKQTKINYRGSEKKNL